MARIGPILPGRQLGNALISQKIWKPRLNSKLHTSDTKQFHTEDPQILDAIVQNVVVRAAFQ